MTKTHAEGNAPERKEVRPGTQACEKPPQDSDREPQGSSKGEGPLRPRDPREYSPWGRDRRR